MAVTRTIKRVEITYDAGVVVYVRIVEELSIPNPAVPAQIIRDENVIPVALSEMTGPEISSLNDLIGNDIMPIANRLEPIV